MFKGEQNQITKGKKGPSFNLNKLFGAGGGGGGGRSPQLIACRVMFELNLKDSLPAYSVLLLGDVSELSNPREPVIGVWSFCNFVSGGDGFVFVKAGAA